MRQIQFAVMALGLALVLAACETAIVEPEPTAPPSPEPPSPSAALPLDGSAREVLDAALATQAAGTLRFDTDVRSADPHDTRPPATASGFLAFDEPLRFRFGSPGLAENAEPMEVIYDGTRAFIRGREVPFVPTDSWVVMDRAADGDVAVDAFLEQYANQSLILVPPLGVTSARPAGEETIDGVVGRHFVAQVDVEQAREHLPAHLLPPYDAQIETFRQRGAPPTHELHVWVGPDGRIVRTSYVEIVSESLDETIEVTNDFGGFGAALDLAPPAGSEVLTLDNARERYAPSSAPVF
jgi:hypothetical protein